MHAVPESAAPADSLTDQELGDLDAWWGAERSVRSGDEDSAQAHPQVITTPEDGLSGEHRSGRVGARFGQCVGGRRRRQVLFPDFTGGQRLLDSFDAEPDRSGRAGMQSQPRPVLGQADADRLSPITESEPHLGQFGLLTLRVSEL